jgi:hypothetical protein
MLMGRHHQGITPKPSRRRTIAQHFTHLCPLLLGTAGGGEGRGHVDAELNGQPHRTANRVL